MIARHEVQLEKTDLWAALAAPLPTTAIAWRQDGRAVQRDGRWVARFVAYVDANTVRERLDAVVPGEWDLTLDLLPPLPGREEEDGAGASFKARLQILGVIREDVGTGRDYKAAATDAFKRAAVRFGIGHELYAMGPNWVEVDGDARHARALEDPQAVHERRQARASARAGERAERAERGTDRGAERPVERGADRQTPIARGHDGGMVVVDPSAAAALDALPASAVGVGIATADEPACPKCSGRMWDNRLTKRNPKAPDFKCRDRACDGVIWPPRANGSAPAGGPPAHDEPEPVAEEPSPRRNGRSRKAVLSDRWCGVGEAASRRRLLDGGFGTAGGRRRPVDARYGGTAHGGCR